MKVSQNRQWGCTMKLISEIVKLSTGYKAVVNIKADYKNYDKVSAYIPTEVGARCLEMTVKALYPECNQRSFMITGTYGFWGTSGMIHGFGRGLYNIIPHFSL